jgi:cobalamin-dependent methionine synthase I
MDLQDRSLADASVRSLVDKVVRYDIHEVAEYINWSYFFHAWNFPAEFATVSRMHSCASCRQMWINAFDEAKRPQAEAAADLYADAVAMLSELDGTYSVSAMFMLFEARSDEDDILIDTVRVPMLRQQIAGADGYCRCVSDYINPRGADRIGVFATSVDAQMVEGCGGDDYRMLLAQTLADRLAEAAAERLHEEVRKRLWGYAPDESLTPSEMHACKYQGIRPAVGYPCMPDMSLNMLLDSICRFGRIGIRLTENGMMVPHASVSGLMISHPQARYFSVGPITEEQVADYARRKGVPVEQVMRFVATLVQDGNQPSA